MADEQETEEGARSFSVFVHDAADGAMLADTSKAWNELITKLRDDAEHFDTKVKGSFKLEIKAQVDQSGVLSFDFEATNKLPKRKRATAQGWVTKGGNVTFIHPRQLSLGMRVIKRGDDYDDKEQDSSIDGVRRGGEKRRSRGEEV